MTERRRERRYGFRASAFGAGIGLALGVLLVGAGAGDAVGATPPLPENIRPPSITGKPQVGQILRADVGRWHLPSGETLVYTFQWRLCEPAGAVCTAVANANDGIYAVRHGDAGRVLRVVVTATVAGGTASTAVSSAPTAQVALARADAPVAGIRPTISGMLLPGKALTANPGTWTGAEPVRFQYRWRICDALGGACRDSGRKGSTYVIRRQDVAHSFRVLVMAKNAVATGAALSDPTEVVPGPVPPGTQAPKATGEPTISGTAQVGNALRATRGTWTGTQPMRFAYQWRHCEGPGKPDASDCAVIDAARKATYTVRRADVGAQLRVQVTARNVAGSATSTSNPTGVVAPATPVATAPKATRAPVISGTAREGQVLRTTGGRWTGAAPITLAYQWVRCGQDGGAADGSNCPIVPGATGTSYRLTSADVGRRMRVRVTATNRVGSTTVASNATATVKAAAVPAPPRNTREPSISGTAVEGQTLTASSGTWVGAQPITFAYSWLRCGPDGGRPDGADCPAIPGATTTAYVLGASDVGQRIRVRVTAKNVAGTRAVASNATSTIQSSAVTGPPRNTTEPSIGGTPVQGQTLSVSGGSWVGAAPIAYTYQWVRCGTDGGRPDGSNCPAIAGATTTRYVLAAGDVGHRLRVLVTARNAQGTVTVASNATATVGASAPALPPGAVRLADGRYSIPVTSVSLPARLVIDRVSFTPNPVRTLRTVIELRVHVVDTRGYVVRDALVFARSTPLVTSPSGEPRTGMDGWATLRMVPQADFPIRDGYSVQFFVRARKPGDNVLAGVSTRRLVQVRTAR